MFLVFNKEKIYSYIVALSTVIVLFFTASILLKDESTIQASSSLNKEVPIYCVKTEESKVALTMNCAWEADDMNEILEILDKTNVKITFFMVGEFIERNPEIVKEVAKRGHEIRKSFQYTSSCKQFNL